MKKVLLITNYAGNNQAQNYLCEENLLDSVEILELRNLKTFKQKINSVQYEKIIIDGNLKYMYEPKFHEQLLKKTKGRNLELCCVNIDLHKGELNFLGCKYADHVRGSGVFYRAVAA